MASPIGNLIHPDPQPQPQSYRPVVHPPTLASLPPSSHLNATTPMAAQSLGVPLPSSPSVSVGPVQSPSLPPPPPTSLPGSSTPRASKGHANSQSLYQCADCLRRYSRPEHLQRHIATHTLGKRFTCDVCTKAFSRADLLKRHRANHFDENGTKRRRINSSPGAGRVAHACVACSKARVKCEEAKPCSRCRNRGITCEYASSEDAAMHLLHLSANNRHSDHPESVHSPESTYYRPPSAPSHQGQQDQHYQPQPQRRAVYDPQHQQPDQPRQQQAVPNPTPVAYPDAVGPPVIKQSPTQADQQQQPHGEAQLPTPETLMEPGNGDGYPPPYPNSGMVDMARMPFSDFLQGVLYDQQTMGDTSKLAEAQGLAVLDFCDNSNLELNDIDFDLLNHWNVDNGMQDPSQNLSDLQPSTDNPIDITGMRSKLVKIWTESPWRWSPSVEDNAYTEQSDLPLITRDAHGEMVDGGRKLDRVIRDKLHPSNRDKVLAIVLGICRNDAMMRRVASSFPSTEMLDSWIHIFLASHLCQVSTWIHYGSFSLNNQWPDWLAITASAGAASTPIPTLRRFGFALHEAVRLNIPTRFEENNIQITDIGLVQALVLVHDVGLWSGNRRKMEIAECHIQIPQAMMRNRGKYQRSAYPVVEIKPSDEGEVLEKKWKRWYELEGWKRLVYHCFLRDAQVSMTQLSNPTMSYAELTLPMPSPKELWFARSAEEFKMRYLEIGGAVGRRPPSIGDLLQDISLLSANHRKIDLQYSISIFLHGFWTLIWEYRQLNSVLRPPAQSINTQNNTTLPLLNARHQDLCKQLQDFQKMTSELHEMLSAQESTLLHLLLMNLNVSLDDLQLFSGKEGEDQARRVYPRLQTWSGSPQARIALWNAGQIFRQAKLFPPGHLKDFYAIAVHHAALCLWTHGVITKATSRAAGASLRPRYDPLLYLDGDDGPHVEQYIDYGAARAVLRAPASRDGSTPPAESLLEDPKGCMEIAQDILRVNFVGVHEGLPPINDNSIQLLKQLGNAAWAVTLP